MHQTSVDINVDYINVDYLTLPTQPLPKVPKENWMKIGHLNVHSYIAKHEDIMHDEAMHATYCVFLKHFFTHT